MCISYLYFDHVGQANFFGGYNNSGFYMFGGQISNSSGRVEISSLYMFNTTHYNWTTNPQTTGQWPEPRDSASGISHPSTGDGYIFGGEPEVSGSSWLFNTTWRLQYGNSWSEVGGSAPGGGRQSHAVAMLSDGRMVILGGSDGAGNAIPLTDVLVFDTNSGTYTSMVCHIIYDLLQFNGRSLNESSSNWITLAERNFIRIKSYPSFSTYRCFQLSDAKIDLKIIKKM
jgi:hypothetical protein